MSNELDAELDEDPYQFGYWNHRNMTGKKKPQSKEGSTAGEFYGEVILSCSAGECTNKGKDVFVDFRVLNHEPFFYVHAYGNPICEHMWKQAREDVDYEIEGFHEKSSAEIVSSVNQKIPKSSTVCPECGASLP